MGMTLEPVVPYLHENNSEFMVIGALGQRGSGKTSILNALHTPLSKKFAFDNRKSSDTFETLFTRDRLILIDTPPLLDLLSLTSSKDGKPFSLRDNDFSRFELQNLLQCLWLLSICHVVVVVLDDDHDTELLQLLNRAEMILQLCEDLKCAQVMFVYNKVRMGCVSPGV